MSEDAEEEEMDNDEVQEPGVEVNPKDDEPKDAEAGVEEGENLQEDFCEGEEEELEEDFWEEENDDKEDEWKHWEKDDYEGGSDNEDWGEAHTKENTGCQLVLIALKRKSI